MKNTAFVIKKYSPWMRKWIINLIIKELIIRYPKDPDYPHKVEDDFSTDYLLFLVALSKDNTVIGTVWIKEKNESTVELNRMFVCSERRVKERKENISQKDKCSQILLKKAMDLSKRSWYRKIFLTTDNPYAVKFYEKNNFKEKENDSKHTYMEKTL